MNAEIRNITADLDTQENMAEYRESAGRKTSVVYTELTRRNVLRATAAYIVVAWLIAQVADILCDGFAAPDWVIQAILVCLALGLPIAIIISWYFEFSAKLKWELDTKPMGAITRQKGRKMDFVIITVLTMLVSVLLVRKPEAAAQSDNLCVMGQNVPTLADQANNTISSTGKTTTSDNLAVYNLKPSQGETGIIDNERSEI